MTQRLGEISVFGRALITLYPQTGYLVDWTSGGDIDGILRLTGQLYQSYIKAMFKLLLLIRET